MADVLTFMMGKVAADLPTDYRYCRNHMWAKESAPGRYRFGFSSYAIKLMKDVYFLDWSVDDGAAVALKQQIGNIETSKAVSDLFSPVAGTITAINGELLKDPSAINTDGYGNGWLFEVACGETGLMTVQEYYQFLESNWEQTQRILKGQMGD